MKTRSLKSTFVAALALIGLGFAVAPTTAEAGGSCAPRYSHRCGSCSSPIYQSYVRIGVDRCGHSVFRWVTNSHSCRHRGSSHGSSYGSSYGGGRGNSGYRSSGGSFSFGLSFGGVRTPYRSSGYRSSHSYGGSRCR